MNKFYNTVCDHSTRPFFLVVVMFVLSTLSYGQRREISCPENVNRPHVEGIFAAEATVAPKEWDGRMAGLAAVYYLKIINGSETLNKFPSYYAKVNLHAVRDQLYKVYHEAYGLDFSVGYIPPVSLFKRIYPSVVVGGFGSYEFPSANKNSLPEDVVKKLTGFKFGGFYGAEVMFFVGHPRLALVVNITQRYLLGQHWGDKRRYFGAGIRYHFYDMSTFSPWKSKKKGNYKKTR